MRSFALLLLLVGGVAGGAVILGEEKHCDACLVLSYELAKGCLKTKPVGLYTEVWVEEMRDKALDGAVANWVWNQPRGYHKGRFKEFKEVETSYGEAPEARQIIEDRKKLQAKQRDPKRYLFLQALTDKTEDSLESLLTQCTRSEGKPATSEVTYNMFALTMCSSLCEPHRLNPNIAAYPEPELVAELKRVAENLKESESTWSGVDGQEM